MDEGEEEDVGGLLLPLVELGGPGVVVVLEALLAVVSQQDVQAEDLQSNRNG